MAGRVRSTLPKTVSTIEMADDEALTSSSFCRICLMRQPNLTPLMDRVDGVMIPEMLYKLCGRQIEVQESYPKSVCERCLCLLDSAFCFLNLFHQQDERLRSFYWGGSVVERLIKYQDEDMQSINKRLEALLERNEKLYATPPKDNLVSMGTMTESSAVASVGTNTEPRKDSVELVKMPKLEPTESDMLDLIELETEDGFLPYSSETIDTDSQEKLVSMKIDVLNSLEPTDEEESARSSRTTGKNRSKQKRRGKRRRTMDVAGHDGATVDVYPVDTDDQSQGETDGKHFDCSESLPETDEQQEIIDPCRCYICDFMAEGVDQLEEHVESHITMIPYECKECIVDGATVRLYKTVSSMHNHFRSHLYPYRCETCGRRFQRRSLLVTHSECHGNEVYNCNECGRQFTHRKTWHNHVQRHSAVRTEVFKCDVCEKVFGNKPRLLRHLQVHTGERPYGCRYCTKRFSDRHQLQCHTEKHIREKECQCEMCGEKFPDHRKLDDHKIAQHLSGTELVEFLALRQQQKAPRRASKLQDNRCPYPDCDYQARTYGAMYVHKRTKHLSIHQCEVCNKTFAFQNQLNTHMKLHTGEKPHECDLCGRRFRRAFSYREHMEMHKSDTSYVCAVCQKSFKRPRYLQAHMLTHTSIRKFACELCGCSYKTNGELKKHSRHKHGLVIAEELPEINSYDDHSNEVYVVEYV